jgi:hypothetical protein
MREALGTAGLTPHQSGSGLSEYLAALINSPDVTREGRVLSVLRLAVSSPQHFDDETVSSPLSSRGAVEDVFGELYIEGETSEALNEIVRALVETDVVHAASMLARPTADHLSRAAVQTAALAFVTACTEQGLPLVPKLALHIKLKKLLAACLDCGAVTAAWTFWFSRLVVALDRGDVLQLYKVDDCVNFLVGALETHSSERVAGEYYHPEGVTLLLSECASS